MATNPKIQAFYDAMKTFNDRKNAAITDLEGDIASLNAKIEELNNRPPGFNDEDQALLDEIQTLGQTVADKLEAVAKIVPPPVVEPPPEV